MVNQIKLSIALLEHLTNDVNDLKANISKLHNEIKEIQNAVKQRQDRFVANIRLLEQLKKERSENNLITSLSEHIEVISLLRQDIVDNFARRSKKSLSFL